MAGPPKRKKAILEGNPQHTPDLPPAVQPTRELSIQNSTSNNQETVHCGTQATHIALSLAFYRESTFSPVEEIPRACLECARRDLTCNLAVVPCERCTNKDLPCIGPLRPCETDEAGFRRQILQLQERTAVKRTKAYGVMRYLAEQFEEGKQGWDALADSINPAEEEDIAKKAENQILSTYVDEMSVMDHQALQEWKDAGEPGNWILPSVIYSTPMQEGLGGRAQKIGPRRRFQVGLVLSWLRLDSQSPSGLLNMRSELEHIRRIGGNTALGLNVNKNQRFADI